ncbi:MAG: hypothetical protein AUJ98_04045 [Bacteroidetes bacterium CG2_30_33_31]|nr:MAG: hypothetical protein AUJ98_04045 [Bacteroidetes bacterium CG2_30_33_31]
MENFTIYNPVKLHFGKNVLENLPASAAQYGNRILLIYGKDSIKKSGLYEKIINLLKDFEVVEYQGIKSNPIIEDVNAAAKIARQNQVDLIIAVGGGSVIDSAKVIASAIYYDGDAWDIMTNKIAVENSKPLFAILTLAATGSEMNAFAVVQNKKTMEKIGWGNPPLSFPKESFLDPMLTYTVSAKYTAYGMADMIAHSLEAYFGDGYSPLSDNFVIANIKEVIQAGKPLLNELNNYDLRARIMYAGTIALNGTMSNGKKYADWGVHSLGHILSLLYDMPHGASLTIAYPAWMKIHSVALADKIIKLGKEIFMVDTVDETISEFEKLFLAFDCPIRIGDWGIPKSDFETIEKYFIKNKVDGMVHKFNDTMRTEVLELMF